MDTVSEIIEERVRDAAGDRVDQAIRDMRDAVNAAQTKCLKALEIDAIYVNEAHRVGTIGRCDTGDMPLFAVVEEGEPPDGRRRVVRHNAFAIRTRLIDHVSAKIGKRIAEECLAAAQNSA